MGILAWSGVAVLVGFLLIVAVIWFVDMLKDPFGRAILFGWGIIAVLAWAATGALYLLWTHGG